MVVPRELHRFIGVGAPIGDALVHLSLSQVEALVGTKGGMSLVEMEEWESLLSAIGEEPIKSIGGSASNVLRGVASLGHPATLLGKVGEDSWGDLFLEGLQKSGVNSTYLSRSSSPTSRALCLIDENGERTMRTAIGASGELRGEELAAEAFQRADWLHLEGYLFFYPDLLERALALGKEHQLFISLDAGSHEVVASHRTAFEEVMEEVDLLFANADEAQVLTAAPPDKAAQQLSERAKRVVVTAGEEGAWAFEEKTLLQQPAHPVERVRDTTGAGDHFTAGVIAAYSRGLGLCEALSWGAHLAAAVIQVEGAELPPGFWKDVRKELGLFPQQEERGESPLIASRLASS